MKLLQKIISFIRGNVGCVYQWANPVGYAHSIGVILGQDCLLIGVDCQVFAYAITGYCGCIRYRFCRY